MVPQHLRHSDGHPHRVALLRLHDVSDLTDEVLGRTMIILIVRYKDYNTLLVFIHTGALVAKIDVGYN